MSKSKPSPTRPTCPVPEPGKSLWGWQIPGDRHVWWADWAQSLDSIKIFIVCFFKVSVLFTVLKADEILFQEEELFIFF